ncbi:MAG: SDR family NAD(P)-dependent oxidoreductase [Flavobacteriales bacterium]|nr:SDR family NAD(P)-dependent oxidoreductase [Flavobacteriales bacterium]
MSNTPIAIVTGAAKGIGRAIAERLANDGFHVLAVDMEPVSENLPSAAPGAGKIMFHLADIRDEQAVQTLFRTAMERHGRVDAVVNNAGIIRDNMIHRMTLEDFQAVIDVNLKGTWLMCREAGPRDEGAGQWPHREHRLAGLVGQSRAEQLCRVQSRCRRAHPRTRLGTGPLWGKREHRGPWADRYSANART